MKTQNSILCRVCKGETTLMPWGGCECLTCGSISVADLPTLEELAEYYEKFNQDYHGGGRKKGAENRQYKRAWADLNRIKRIRPCGTLIDIGSSTSPFPNIARQAGYQVTAVDYIKPVKLHPEIRFITGSLNDPGSMLSEAKKQYDIVTALYVLEHCLDPKGALDTLNKLCAPSGIIVISTPEINGFADRNALGRTPWFYPPEHIHLVSKVGMRIFFNQQDLSLIYAKKQEHSLVRWILRYGFGAVLGTAGYMVRILNRNFWSNYRMNKKSGVQNICFYVFAKRPDGQKIPTAGII